MRTRTLLVAALALAGAAFAGTPERAQAAPDEKAAQAADDRTAQAADECLARPKGAPPQGRHWFYRIERPSQRRCWYLGDASARKSAEAASTKDAASEDNAAPPPKRAAAAPAPSPRATSTMQRPVANARAELIDTPPVEQPAAAQRQPDTVPDVTGGMTSRAWSVASRWADASNSAMIGAAPAASTAPVQLAQTAPAQESAAPINNATPVAAPAAEQTQAPGDAPGGIDYLLLALCASMFAFAAFMAWTIFRSARPLDTNDFPSARRARHGDDVDDVGDEMPSAVFAPAAAKSRSHRHDAESHRRDAPSRPPRRLDDDIEEMERMLAAARHDGVTADRQAWNR